MKALQICSYYPINDIYKNLFDKLKDNKIESTVYVPCKPKVIPDEYFDDKNNNIIYSGVYKNGDNIYEKAINIFNQYQFYYKNNKIYKEMIGKIDVRQYSIVHAHSLFENGYLAYKMKKEFGIDYVVAIRNTDVNGYFKKARHLRKIGLEIMKNAKNIIFISPSYKEKVLSEYINKEDLKNIEKKSRVIPNGIDDFWINNILEYEKTSKYIGRDKIKLIQVSRLDSNKNIDTSIEICKSLNERGIMCELTIVGDGPLEKILKKKYSYMKNIYFKGRENRENIKKYYDMSDIFIMPSKFETFGLVYAEAISRGLPVVYTRGQGFDKFFEDGEVGYPMKYNDIKEGQKVIISIINNYECITKKAREKSKMFSWERIANIYKEIYLNS